jgi:16S rRNA G966 N2-methylase RsmD
LPFFKYLNDKRAWETTIQGTKFITHDIPLWEVARELRGYTMLGNLNEYSNCLDLGSGSGLSGIYSAKKARMGKTCLVEADCNAISLLERNLSFNFCNNVNVCKKAVHQESNTSQH